MENSLSIHRKLFVTRLSGKRLTLHGRPLPLETMPFESQRRGSKSSRTSKRALPSSLLQRQPKDFSVALVLESRGLMKLSSFMTGKVVFSFARSMSLQRKFSGRTRETWSYWRARIRRTFSLTMPNALHRQLQQERFLLKMVSTEPLIFCTRSMTQLLRENGLVTVSST